MPIVDGMTSTKMIRSYEKSHPANHLSRRAALNGRIPIFAVSASLIEKEKQTCMDIGFDGWILKPINFKRVETLLTGIVEEDTRNGALYEPGQWERGGWFEKKSVDPFAMDTKPSDQAPILASKPPVGSPEPVDIPNPVGLSDSDPPEKSRTV
jgi:DNA-binding response OmpR family regulator